MNAKSGEPEEDSEDDGDTGDDTLNFRDLLKAKALHLDVPTQIVWPDTWDDAARIPRKVKRASNRQAQATATRAWNLLNALFYKAGKVPWRLLPNEADYRTNFLGIGFYRDLGGQQLWTSLRVPRSLLLVPHENSDSALYRLAEEVFALTKVNWNSTQFDQKLPAPIKASREVGRVLKHVSFDVAVSPDFRKYT